jgi:hypothetical protein
VGESSMESEMGEPENEMVLISDIETSEPDEEDKKVTHHHHKLLYHHFIVRLMKRYYQHTDYR